MYKGLTDVFFDLDHTLWDFETNSALAFEKILERNRVMVELDAFLAIYSPINFEMWKRYREQEIGQEELRYQRLKRTFDALNMEVGDGLIHRLSHEYIEQLPLHAHLLPNTLEVLEYLKPKYNLHIITNGFQEVQSRKLKGSGIERYFDILVNSEMAGAKKPDPRIFQMALEMAKADPGRSLMVGDNLQADILGARQMGMQAIHFNSNGEDGHDICTIIHDLIEIKSLI